MCLKKKEKDRRSIKTDWSAQTAPERNFRRQRSENAPMCRFRYAEADKNIGFPDSIGEITFVISPRGSASRFRKE